jgi:hypothetical protein
MNESRLPCATRLASALGQIPRGRIADETRGTTSALSFRRCGVWIKYRGGTSGFIVHAEM